ncbi:MAG: cache domain-containing protein, partial [Planctomycetota bacterium]|nr:cache domain-containing protein [Planctomycetota bacterium]
MQTPVPSIRAVLAAAVIVPALAVGAILIWLSSSTATEIGAQLGETALAGAMDSVEAELAGYLVEAERFSSLTVSRIQNGDLPADDFGAWQEPMVRQLNAFENIAVICFGTTDPRTVWLVRTPTAYEIGRQDASTGGLLVEHRVSFAGSRDETPVNSYEFNPQVRPWWIAGQDTIGGRWSAPYTWIQRDGADHEISVAFARRVLSSDGRFLGVLSVDLTLDELSVFLSQTPFSRSGELYVLDNQGRLVASSSGGVVTQAGERPLLADAGDERARLVAAALIGRDAAGPRAHFEAQFEEGPAWVRQRAFQSAEGVDWTIVAALPEAEFLAGAREIQRHAFLVGLAALGAVVLLAALLARWISRPIMAVRAHVGRVAQGDFESRLS